MVRSVTAAGWILLIMLLALVVWAQANTTPQRSAAPRISDSLSTTHTVAKSPYLLRLENGDGGVSLATYSEYLLDDQGSLTIDQVRAFPEERFERYRSLNLAENPGSNKAVYWLRFQVNNPAPETLDAVLLLSNSLLRVVEVYLPQSDGGYTEQHLAPHMPVVMLELPGNSRQTYYVRLRAEFASSFPMYLYTGQGFFEYLFKNAVHKGLVFGVMFGLFAYNAILWLSARRPLYAYYLGANISIMLMFLSGHNALPYIFDSFSLGGWDKWRLNVAVYAASPMLFVAFYTQFTRQFFDTRNLFPQRDRVLRLSIIYCLFCAALGFYHQTAIELSYLPVVVLVGAINLPIAVQRFFEAYRPARFYLGGLLVLLIAGIWTLLTFSGVVETQQSTMLVGESMALVHLILLSLGIADQISLLHLETASAEQIAVQARLENQAKTEFLNTMNHEIRTPMTGVIGMSELLRNSRMSGEQRQFVDIIHSSGQSLLTIIDDIIDYGRFEDGQLRLQLDSFDLDEVLSGCADVFELSAANKQLCFCFMVAGDVPKRLYGDASRLRQILLNLLGNAFKFTQHGFVILRIGVMAKKAGQCRLRFAVSDSGIGINKAAQAKLFQPYLQADKTTARKFGGSGLGLTISKALVEKMHGEIGVESEPDKGATFWFNISVSEAPRSDAVTDQLLSEHPPLELLYIFTNRVYAQYLQETAAHQALHIGLVGSIAEARQTRQYPQRLSALLVDAADVGLAEETNRAFIRQCLEKMPVIGLCGLASSGEQDRLQALGVKLFLSQSAMLTQLSTKLRQCVMQQSATQFANESSDARVRPNIDSNDQHQASAGKVLLAEDNVVNQRVLEKMLHGLGYSVDSVFDGSQALQAYCDDPDTYQLIILDGELPTLSGQLVAQAIRTFEKSESLPEIAIIGVSAHIDEAYVTASKEMGMNDFLLKPLRFEQLKHSLLKVLANA